AYTVGDRKIIEGITPNFWRAATDNDWGNNAHRRLNAWRCAWDSRRCTDVNVEGNVLTATYELPDVDATLQLSYSVYQNGVIDVSFRLDGEESMPEAMRIGLQLAMPKAFDRFSYYGRGPLENYSDRNTAAFMGRWNSHVSDEFYPYIRPQETGNHTDVREASLTDASGLGIEVRGAQPLNVSALDVRPDDLDPGLAKHQMHNSDVRHSRTQVFLNVDLAQRGLGGDDSWGAAPHAPYILRDKAYAYTFRLSPLR
ncbi:MAG: beta-galactosidase, partial [Muribaculaceae bacterium]|nr:beta-galactosidase [Muribaculaceae bacterium]